MKGTDVSLILPCYNEEPIFADSVVRILRVLENTRLSSEIIFVDDKSRDETPHLIQQLCRNYPFCRAIYHHKNIGRGETVADGMRLAVGRAVGYIDIDCEVSPVYLPEMVSLIREKKADIVLGNRIYRTTLGSMPREILSRGYRWLCDTMLDTGGIDTESGYKFFNRKKILPILHLIRHPGWFWDTEIMVLAKRAGLKIIELPVLYERRMDKQSSVNIIEDTIDYVVNLWRLRWRLAGRGGSL